MVEHESRYRWFGHIPIEAWDNPHPLLLLVRVPLLGETDGKVRYNSSFHVMICFFTSTLSNFMFISLTKIWTWIACRKNMLVCILVVIENQTFKLFCTNKITCKQLWLLTSDQTTKTSNRVTQLICLVCVWFNFGYNWF